MFELLKIKIHDILADIADALNDFFQIPYKVKGWEEFNSARSKGINFRVSKGAKSLTLYSDQAPGLYIALPLDAKPGEILEIMDDALMVYYDVPRRLLKKVKLNTRLIDSKTGKSIERIPIIKDGRLQYKNK